MRPASPRYRSVYDVRRAAYWRRAKASARYLGATLAFGLFCVSFASSEARVAVHGTGGNGGSVLELKTILSDDDINYNREFQRMRYLDQNSPSNNGSTNGYVLAENGITTTNTRAASEYRRKAPHYKYY